MSIRHNGFKVNKIAASIGGALAIMLSAATQAEMQEVKLKIESKIAGKAILDLAEQTGSQIAFPDALNTKLIFPEIEGRYTVVEALDFMLEGTGFVYQVLSDSSIVVNRAKDKTKSEDEKESYEELVVTGTRLKGDHPIASPVTTFTREDIERGGYSSLQDIFRRLPQNLSTVNPQSTELRQFPAAGDTNTQPLSSLGSSSVDLRGLGAGSTLILINGRRKARAANANGGFVDLSSIPLSQVERVEVLNDGASAVYGSDAVAGVVNIILRKGYEGAELNVRHEDSGSGANLSRLTGTYGFSWDSGQLNISVDLSESKSADTNKFVHSGPTGPGDFTDLNGTNQRLIGYDAVNPTTFAVVDSGPFFHTYDSTAPLQEGEGGSVFRRRDLGPAVKQNTVRLFGSQELSDSLNLDFDASYSKQEDSRIWQPDLRDISELNLINFGGRDISGRPDALNRNELLQFGTVIPDTNPNNPFGTEVIAGYTWDREFALLDSFSEENEQDDIALSLTLSGAVAFLDDWDFELSYSYSDSEGMREPMGLFNLSRPEFLPSEVQADILNFWNTVNIFSDDPADVAANAAQLGNFVNDAASSRFNSNAQTIDFILKTDSLFSLPAGDVAMSAGVQYRDEDIFQDDVITFGYGTYEELPTDNNSQTKAVFFEANLPLLRDIPFIQSLSVNVAARYESVDNKGLSQLAHGAGDPVGDFYTGDLLLYSLPGVDIEALTGFALPPETVIVGEGGSSSVNTQSTFLTSSYSSTSPSVKLNWQVNDELRFRATWGESFQAPLVASQFGQQELQSNLFQFFFNGGVFPDSFSPDVFNEVNVVLLSGSNPNLEEQTAETITYGFDYTPAWLEGLSLGVTYSRQSYDNFIFSFPFAGEPEFLPFGQNVEDYPQLFQITTGAGGAGVVQDVLFWDIRTQNVAERKSESVDIDVRYSIDTDIGLWSTRLAATRTFEVLNRIDERVDPRVFSDTENGPGKWKGNLELSWTGAEYSATMFVNYEDDTRVVDPFSASPYETSAFGMGLTNAPQSKTGSYTTVDLQVRYSPKNSGWMEGMEVSLGAQNIFEPDFPFVDNNIGYVASKVNTRGRVFYLDVRKYFNR